MIMWPPKTQLLYHNANAMLLLADKLNLVYYVLYVTKELLSIGETYITIINILVFIINTAIAVITISIIIVFVKSAWRIC